MTLERALEFVREYEPTTDASDTGIAVAACCKLLLDIHDRLNQIPIVKLVCGAHYYQHGRGWVCSLPVGHEGDHCGQ